MIDRMMGPVVGATPAAEPTKVAPVRNPHAGAATVVKDGLDETAELFKTVFKGEIVP